MISSTGSTSVRRKESTPTASRRGRGRRPGTRTKSGWACRSQAQVFFAFGPDTAWEYFRVDYSSPTSLTLTSAGEEALEYHDSIPTPLSIQRSIVLEGTTSDDESRTVWASRRTNGDLQIIARTRGPGVERFWGDGIIELEQIPDRESRARVCGHQGSRTSSAYDDVLDVLRKKWPGRPMTDIEDRLTKQDVPFEAWSNVGE